MRIIMGLLAVLAAVTVWAQELPPFQDLPVPNPMPAVPGPEFTPPVVEGPAAEGATVVYSHSGSAASDESTFLTGAGFGAEFFLWGLSPKADGGAQIGCKVSAQQDDMAFVTINQNEQDGVYLLWPGKGGTWGAPVRINAPEPWWVTPSRIHAGEAGTLWVGGRNLMVLPDHQEAWAWLVRAGMPARRLVADAASTDHMLRLAVPADVEPGQYEVWVYAGTGGSYGWGGPVGVEVLAPRGRVKRTTVTAATGEELQRVLDEAGQAGGGEVLLAGGEYDLDRGLKVPAGVTLSGPAGGAATLRLANAPKPTFTRPAGGQWGQGPGRIHTVGDELVYDINVAQAGDYTVWMRYGTNMAPWNAAGMDGRTSLRVDDGAPVKLMNLPNTGGFGPTAWSRAATLTLPAGKHQLTWRNDSGGGLGLDAYVLALDPAWNPGEAASVEPADGLLVVQAEDVVRMASKEGELPGAINAVVWLCGDGAGLRDLRILGSQFSSTGVLIRHEKPRTWVQGATVTNVRVEGLAGKTGENSGVLIERAQDVRVEGCALTARTPIFMRGIRQGVICNNELTSVTRTGGNAEAAILGRTDTVSQCVIDGNSIRSPRGAGGPTARRMIWLSTGHGSVDDNYLAHNTSEPMQFGGVAGTEQNVGEMILLEANQRLAYYGPIEAGDATGVQLPEAGPFWPPEDEWQTEPALSSYYLQVVSGRGLGQVRRVVGREGRRLLVERAWRVAPDASSRVVLCNLYVHNIIEGNEANDGMTGIQLWIGCFENVVAGNRIARQRKPGIFCAAFSSTAGPTMVNTWNRGIGVMWYNDIVGNRVEDCSAGVLMTNYNQSEQLGWPLTLGNTIRGNTFINSRGPGMTLSGGKLPATPEPSGKAVVGTVAEFNVMRDQPLGVSVTALARGTLVRRNHVYFWYGWTPEKPPTAFSTVGATETVLEQNTVEGKTGGGDKAILEVDTGEPKP